MEEIKIGIIGGSGLYEVSGLKEVQEISLNTPFGSPSDVLISGVLDGVQMVFLPRHGRGHFLNPSEVNYRANIYAMKQLGVTDIVSISAVGSLREEIAPGDFLVVDQFIDRTKGIRAASYFEKGVVGHVPFANPVCLGLKVVVCKAALQTGKKVHDKGTYLCIEGPQFSTKAESKLYRTWGADVIGMTNVPESKLAREAEICYNTVALVTDYDCWRENEKEVSVDEVLKTLHDNVEGAKKIISSLPKYIREKNYELCSCGEALKYAVITAPEKKDKKTEEKLAILLKKYM